MADKKYMTDSERKTLAELIEAVMDVPESVQNYFLGYAQAVKDLKAFKEKGAAS